MLRTGGLWHGIGDTTVTICTAGCRSLCEIHHIVGMKAYNTEMPVAFAIGWGETMPDMQLTSSLRVIALFDELGEADLTRISARCAMFTYRKHAQILGEHEATDDVFFILAGSVRINSMSPKGREVIYTESHAGNI